MNLITLKWLRMQSQNPDIEPQIQQDLGDLLSYYADGKLATEYLKPRAMLIDVSATTGGSGNDPTSAIKALPCELVKEGTYMQIIPDMPENFFKNLEQVKQVVRDNTALREEVLQGHRLHLPLVYKNTMKCVACVFKCNDYLGIRLSNFESDYVFRTFCVRVFVFPQQPSGS